MAKYVDGFVLTVPKKNVKRYRKIAAKAGKVWKEHGALEYLECMGDDLKWKYGTQFPKMAKAKPNETVFFSYIVYKSKAHRNSVNKKVMNDPRMQEMMNEMTSKPVFNGKRMAYGGFKVLVDLA